MRGRRALFGKQKLPASISRLTKFSTARADKSEKRFSRPPDSGAAAPLPSPRHAFDSGTNEAFFFPHASTAALCVSPPLYAAAAAATTTTHGLLETRLPWQPAHSPFRPFKKIFFLLSGAPFYILLMSVCRAKRTTWHRCCPQTSGRDRWISSDVNVHVLGESKLNAISECYGA